MSEPDWKTDLCDQLDALSGAFPDLQRSRALRALVTSLMEVYGEAAYQRGLQAGRSQAGYSTRRKSKEEPCRTGTAGAAGSTPASNTGES